MQRRIILGLSVIALILVVAVTGLTVHILSQKDKAEDIITLAKEEARTILVNAKTEATLQLTSSREEANIEAEQIKVSAQNEADRIINEAINTKIDEVEVLLAITEAEAGNQPVEGRAAVTSTVLNRRESDKFPDDIISVVYAPGQFQPVSSGKINNVNISETTYKAAEIALKGNDYSNGALYFYNPEISTPENKKWFNTMTTTAVIGEHVFKR